jgi:Orange carotenoid protein, N-terminal
MTSTNVNFLEQSVSKFQNLHADDRLSVLAELYQTVDNEVPVLALNELPTEGPAALVGKVQKLPKEEQLTAIRQLLLAKSSQGNEAGESSISISDYKALSDECKLVFWYQLAKNLGGSIISIPGDYMPSEEATEVLDLLQSANIQDLVSFMNQVL